MRFLRVLGFATMALALPSPPVQKNSAALAKRGVEDSVVFKGLSKRGSIDQAYSTAAANLTASVNPKITAIQSSVTTLKSSTDAQVTAQALANIRTNLQGIAMDLRNNGIAISQTYSGLGPALAGLTQADIDNLTTALNTITSDFTNIEATLVLVQSVSASTTAAVASDIQAVRLGAASIVIPTQALVSSVIGTGLAKQLNINNLTEAYARFGESGDTLVSGP